MFPRRSCTRPYDWTSCSSPLGTSHQHWLAVSDDCDVMFEHLRASAQHAGSYSRVRLKCAQECVERTSVKVVEASSSLCCIPTFRINEQAWYARLRDGVVTFHELFTKRVLDLRFHIIRMLERARVIVMQIDTT